MVNYISLRFKLVYTTIVTDIIVNENILLPNLKFAIENDIFNVYGFRPNDYDIVEVGNGELHTAINLNETVSIKNKFTYNIFYIRPINNRENFTCVICLSHHSHNSRITLGCNHIFGTTCYFEWCQYRNYSQLPAYCPQCRHY